MKEFILEACVDSVESAVAATNAGANRLELCANLLIGGTTPTLATFTQVRKKCENRIHVLIRPRFGDFCYTEDEFEIMKQEVIQFKEAGADGVVIGILKPDGSLNDKQMKELIEVAGDMSITLHRAFDVCNNALETLKIAKELGIHTILTSGQKNLCLEGIDKIADLVTLSQGTIDILVGSGVDASVISRVYKTTKATSYHMSGKITVDSKMVYRREAVHMGLNSLSEFEMYRTSEKKIKEAVEILQKL